MRQIENLQKQHAKLLTEAYKLSHKNRRRADEKMAEAHSLMEKIMLLKKELEEA